RDACWMGLRFGAVVHGNPDGQIACFGVWYGCYRLRHDAVIGGHHKNDDVGRLGAARAHGGERLVPWGIEESHHAARRLNVISADMLRDAARFSRSDTAAANVIQQRSLAMVDVT